MLPWLAVTGVVVGGITTGTVVGGAATVAGAVVGGWVAAGAGVFTGAATVGDDDGAAGALTAAGELTGALEAPLEGALDGCVAEGAAGRPAMVARVGGVPAAPAAFRAFAGAGRARPFGVTIVSCASRTGAATGAVGRRAIAPAIPTVPDIASPLTTTREASAACERRLRAGFFLPADCFDGTRSGRAPAASIVT